MCVRAGSWLDVAFSSGVRSCGAAKWDLACLKGVGNNRAERSPGCLSSPSLCWLYFGSTFLPRLVFSASGVLPFCLDFFQFGVMPWHSWLICFTRLCPNMFAFYSHSSQLRFKGSFEDFGSVKQNFLVLLWLFFVSALFTHDYSANCSESICILIF